MFWSICLLGYKISAVLQKLYPVDQKNRNLYVLLFSAIDQTEPSFFDRNVRCETFRLSTFRWFPVSFGNPVVLAASGFSYTGRDDIVQCFRYCKLATVYLCRLWNFVQEFYHVITVLQPTALTTTQTFGMLLCVCICMFNKLSTRFMWLMLHCALIAGRTKPAWSTGIGTQ